MDALFVRARCLSFSRTFAIAFLLTGRSGSGACESRRKLSPFARLSKPSDDADELDLCMPFVLPSDEPETWAGCCCVSWWGEAEGGGGGGAAACQAAVRSVEAEYATMARVSRGEVRTKLMDVG